MTQQEIDESSRNSWSTWLQNRSPTELTHLSQAMREKGFIPSPENAENTKQVELLRPPVLDFIAKDSPPYVDVHNLLDLFNTVAYHYNLLLKGPKGCGKSLAVDHFARISKTPKITMNCSEDSKEKHILGNFIIKQGANGIESPWVLGSVAKAIDIANEYGRAILVFEEVNALTPQIQKQLNSLLDFRKCVDIGQLSRSFFLRENAFLWIVGTMNPCFHPDTDVLTPNGVKKVIDLKVGDSIYSFNKETGESELDTVAKVWATPCDGELIVVENQHVKLRITPQHKMVVKSRSAKSWDLKTAGELAEWMEDKGPTNADKLYPKPYNLPDGEDMPMFSLRGYEEWMPKTNTKNTTKTLYQTDDFLRLLGWYISEGSTYFTAKGEYRVHIAQQKQPNLSYIENLLNRMEINFFPAMKGTEQSGIVFNNKLLFHALRHYGGVGSENKKIDNSLFKLSRKHLNCLFETMYLGDGDNQSERSSHAWSLARGTKVFRSMRYSTKSHQLYLDVLWLGTYLGYITSRHHDAEGMYRIGMRKGRPHTAHLEYETIQYDGMVIDVEVTKNRTICAGEDGKFLFVSNSVYGGTYELNEDLRSRWVEVDIAYPKQEQEQEIIHSNVPFTPAPAPAPNSDEQLAAWNKIVVSCVKLGNETRTGDTQYALSSRDLVTLVRLIQNLGVEKAMQLLACKFEGDDRKTIIARITAMFPGVYPKDTWVG